MKHVCEAFLNPVTHRAVLYGGETHKMLSTKNVRGVPTFDKAIAKQFKMSRQLIAKQRLPAKTSSVQSGRPTAKKSSPVEWFYERPAKIEMYRKSSPVDLSYETERPAKIEMYRKSSPVDLSYETERPVSFVMEEPRPRQNIKQSDPRLKPTHPGPKAKFSKAPSPSQRTVIPSQLNKRGTPAKRPG